MRAFNLILEICSFVLIRHARKRSEEIRGTKGNGVTVDQSLKTSTTVDR